MMSEKIIKITQTEVGKAFEYAIASEIQSNIRMSILVKNSALKIAEKSFEILPEKNKQIIKKAADKAANFLITHDENFGKCETIALQNDNVGKTGDVRDIILDCGGLLVGISAKHNHKAIKHPRLSDTIDFGKLWSGFPCSIDYIEAIKPVFENMRQEKLRKSLFSEIEDKNSRYYVPVLNAFEKELKLLCENHEEFFVKQFFRYLLGRYDFYKIMKERMSVSIQFINMDVGLLWGKRWKIPSRIDSIVRKRNADENSENTLLVSFEGGWQISFRLHNASSKVEPSLKFDINFVGMPQNVSRHEIML